MDIAAQIGYGITEEEHEEKLGLIREQVKKHGTKFVAEAVGLSQRYILEISRGKAMSHNTIEKIDYRLISKYGI